jgi:(p)ppGpp synthase/HD superfamily hydrolase
MKCKKYPIYKNTALNDYLFADYDKDGFKNIDDSQPFNPKKKPRARKKGFHTSMMYDPEVRLSTQLKRIQEFNNENKPFLRAFLRKHKHSYGRVKSVPSTLKKLNDNYLPKIYDTIAASILTKNRAIATQKLKHVKKKYKFNVVKDYYKKPKGGTHHGYHVLLITPSKRQMEVQIKSKKFAKLDIKTHSLYKSGVSLKPYRKYAKNLYSKGY